MFGTLIRSVLPESHLKEDSKNAVKAGMGLVTTMCALVLALLISSAKNSYDAQNTELTEMSAKVVMLDRILAHFGEVTMPLLVMLVFRLSTLFISFELFAPANGTAVATYWSPSSLYPARFS
jgi:hypothetical protein